MSSTLNKFNEFPNYRQSELLQELVKRNLIVMKLSDFQIARYSLPDWDAKINTAFKEAYYEQTDPVKHQEIKDYIATKYNELKKV
jgi:hypothetical protein